MTEWDPFERRLRRVDELRQRWPFAEEVLRYLRALTEVQQEVFVGLRDAPAPIPRELDEARLLPFVAPLLRRIEAVGIAELSQAAALLHAVPAAEWARLLRARWSRGPAGGEALAELIPEALLVPYAVLAAARHGDQFAPPAQPRAACPFCDRLPLLGLLRTEPVSGTVSRSLLCGRCATEWRFPEARCPACGEDEPPRLPRFSAAELPGIRVEACHTCRRYLKVIDLSRAPDAEPLTDEIAATPLDAHAAEEGYTKLARNLIGV